jgi:hypothetical protein
MLITRLFLMHLTATCLSGSAITSAYVRILCSVQWHKYSPPKVFSRPADFSPGEYDMLAHLFGGMIANGDPSNCDSEERWFTLAIANAYLYEAPKSEVEKASSS